MKEIVGRETPVDQLQAPCNPTGRVDTLDQETKEGECNCANFRCLVDSRNNVVQMVPQKRTEPQPTV